jgi:glycosyltransferase involved in cell wall biosynthesis
MTSHPRLLAIGPLPPPINGMSKAFDFVVRNLPRYGWAVQGVDSADRSPHRVASSFSLLRAVSVARVLREALRRVPSVDLVYLAIAQSRWGFAKDLAVIQASAGFRRPIVAHLHGGNFEGFYSSLTSLERRMVRGTVDRLTRIVVLTEGLKKDFRMTRDWQARTIAISNACAVPPGTPRRLREGELHVLYLSNLIVSKGYREVTLAVADLANRRPGLQVRLDLAGALTRAGDFETEAAQAADLRAMFAALPSNAAATYHGVVDGPEKERLLRDADVFVLPTRYRNEGQPIAVLEALTSGLPVIATDWRGIRESIPAAMTAYLVPPQDVRSISEKLGQLVDDPNAFAELSESALARADAFRPEHHLAALDSVLREALSSGES